MAQLAVYQEGVQGVTQNGRAALRLESRDGNPLVCGRPAEVTLLSDCGNGSTYHKMVGTTLELGMQRFKSVYFSDFPAEGTKARNLKLAFGKSDETLWTFVDSLSCEDMRLHLGSSYQQLKENASIAGISLNSWCINRLREAWSSANDDKQLELPAIENSRFTIDPIQTTFRGGIKEPLQGWYPYLEGYSPDFVKAILERYAPDARHVLDPFGGTGTTPLTSASLGISSSYCELNPVLLRLINAKIEVLMLGEDLKFSLSSQLGEIAESLPKLLKQYKPESDLRSSYVACFGKSIFFDGDTFDTCMKLRSWLDDKILADPLVGRVAEVAVISALIPSSNLIRRGDLRFRKGQSEWDAKTSILREISAGLHRMSDDIRSLPRVHKRPQFVVDDAKTLIGVQGIDADVVITSPPYLNGTNYYRNTKVELWFSRGIQNSVDLAGLRRRTVTAGINDVSARPHNNHASELIRDVVSALSENCYDRRIPQMASHYFEDMSQVLAGLEKHSKPGAKLVMDIGDSTYAGVHVDTPAILAEMMNRMGWGQVEEVPLRQRMSRSGLKLRQVLLVGTRASGRAESKVSKKFSIDLDSSWENFKRTLPHQRDDYAKRNWGSPLHSLCSYQGKMKPSLAHHLVKAFVPKGGRMLDVFTGVGTIPFEAASMGSMNYGFDISPVALPVAKAKTSRVDKEKARDLISRLDSHIKGGRINKSDKAAHENIKFNGALSGYFHSETFREILLARRFFQDNPPKKAHEALVFAALLHVLHGNRPYALSRRSHPITPFAPTGDFEYKSLIEKVTEKVEKSLATVRPEGFVYGETLRQDATKRWPDRVSNLDAIITSPPFYDSTRFYLANWMRLWMAGWSAEDFRSRPLKFVDERQKESMDIYIPILRQAKERLRDGGVCVFHLGSSRKCDMAAEIEILAAPFFSRREIFVESVEHCESHGIVDKGTVTAHTYLILN